MLGSGTGTTFQLPTTLPSPKPSGLQQSGRCQSAAQLPSPSSAHATAATPSPRKGTFTTSAAGLRRGSLVAPSHSQTPTRRSVSHSLSPRPMVVCCSGKLSCVSASLFSSPEWSSTPTAISKFALASASTQQQQHWKAPPGLSWAMPTTPRPAEIRSSFSPSPQHHQMTMRSATRSVSPLQGQQRLQQQQQQPLSVPMTAQTACRSEAALLRKRGLGSQHAHPPSQLQPSPYSKHNTKALDHNLCAHATALLHASEGGLLQDSLVANEQPSSCLQSGANGCRHSSAHQMLRRSSSSLRFVPPPAAIAGAAEIRYASPVLGFMHQGRAAQHGSTVGNQATLTSTRSVAAFESSSQPEDPLAETGGRQSLLDSKSMSRPSSVSQLRTDTPRSRAPCRTSTGSMVHAGGGVAKTQQIAQQSLQHPQQPQTANPRSRASHSPFTQSIVGRILKSRTPSPCSPPPLRRTASATANTLRSASLGQAPITSALYGGQRAAFASGASVTACPHQGGSLALGLGRVAPWWASVLCDSQTSRPTQRVVMTSRRNTRRHSTASTSSASVPSTAAGSVAVASNATTTKENLKLEASNPASKGCKGLAGIYWDLASYCSVPALVGRITDEFLRVPPVHLLPESVSTPVVEQALTSLIVDATGGPAEFTSEDQTACSTAPDAEHQHSQQQRQEQEQEQQQQRSFLDELERKATWASFEQAVRHAAKESSINEALTTQLLAAVRVTLALRRADLIREAANKRSRFTGGASSSEGSTEAAAAAATLAAAANVATTSQTIAESVSGVTHWDIATTGNIAEEPVAKAELTSPELLKGDDVAFVAGDGAEAAARSPGASSTCPVEQSGNSAMPNQTLQMDRRPSAAAKSVAARLGSPGARAASPGTKAANPTSSGQSHGQAGVKALRNGRLSAASRVPAAKRQVQPKQRPSTSPRFGRVAHRDSAPGAGPPPEQRGLEGAACLRKPSQLDETPPPPRAGPPLEVSDEAETSAADVHCLGRMPQQNGDPLQWLAPPLDLGEVPTAEWPDNEIDVSEGPVHRSSGEPRRSSQGPRDAIPTPASRLSVHSSGGGRGRGGRGRGGRARGDVQRKASRWH